MKFLMIVKGTEQSEAGVLPTEQQFAEMGEFNKKLESRFKILEADGLRPSSHGVRIDFSGSQRLLRKGPFPEPEKLVSGFWIVDAPSLEQLVELAKEIPFESGQVEIRPFHQPEDFA